MVKAEIAWSVCVQIETAIYHAQRQGVLCAMPKTVEIDGHAFHFSTSLADWQQRYERFSQNEQR